MKKEEKSTPDLNDFVWNVENLKLNKPVPLYSVEIELISVFAASYVARARVWKMYRMENIERL